MSNPKIDGVEILGVTVVLYGEIEENETVDLGALTIERDGREFILDVAQSYRKFEGGFTTIETDLEKDEDIFGDCPYDITSTDLMSDDLNITFFIGGDFSANIEHITLFVRFGGENGMTKAIDVQNEVTTNYEEIEKAKEVLRSAGYFVDNLWQTQDVTERWECTEEEAQDVLDNALTNECSMEQIWYAINMFAEDEGYKNKEE